MLLDETVGEEEALTTRLPCAAHPRERVQGNATHNTTRRPGMLLDVETGVREMRLQPLGYAPRAPRERKRVEYTYDLCAFVCAGSYGTGLTIVEREVAWSHAKRIWETGSRV